MIDENLILVLGFVAVLFAVLGGVWTAYKLLGHAIHRELTNQGERIGNLEAKVDNHEKEVNKRLDREMTRRHQSEKEAQDGRANLATRILVVEKNVRRIAGDRLDD
ncbi:MAG: hypothetical protein OXE46_11235 [Chloroflexi bacterium]|nr:hypothetical protein [Chloroflexota bacterium]